MKCKDFVLIRDSDYQMLAVNPEEISSVCGTNIFDKKDRKQVCVISMKNGDKIRVIGYLFDLIPFLSGEHYKPFLNKSEFMRFHDRSSTVYNINTGEVFKIEEALKRYNMTQLAAEFAWDTPDVPNRRPCAKDLLMEFIF